MQFVKAKCPSCGGILEVDKSLEAAICKHCGSAFIVEKAINNFNTINNISNSNVVIYGNVEDNNSNIDRLIKNANEFISLGNTSKAMEIYKSLLVKHPENGEIFKGCQNLMDLLIESENKGEAINLYKFLLEKYPGNEEIFKGCQNLIDLLIESENKEIALDFSVYINNIFPKKFEFWEKRLDLMYSIILERKEFSLKDEGYTTEWNRDCLLELYDIQLSAEKYCPPNKLAPLKEKEKIFYDQVIKGIHQGTFSIIKMLFGVNRKWVEYPDMIHLDLSSMAKEAEIIKEKLSKLGIEYRTNYKTNQNASFYLIIPNVNESSEKYWDRYNRKNYNSDCLCIFGYESLLSYSRTYDDKPKLEVEKLDFEAMDSNDFYQKALKIAWDKITNEGECPNCGNSLEEVEEKKYLKKRLGYKICKGCKLKFEDKKIYDLE